MPTVWELPVCKIQVGEQPEEAIARLVDEDLSLTVKKMKIRDAITFTEYVDASKIYSLYIIYDIDIEDNEDGQEIKRGGEFIGFATSRVAEYYALKEGCEQAMELGFKTVRFVSDNLMMVNQMNGIYQVKNNDILPIYSDINKLIQNFDAVAFTHVKRERNIVADSEANKAIDRHFGI